MTTDKPTADDILAAIHSLAHGDYLDPTVTPVCWRCALYTPSGAKDDLPGEGFTAAEALGMAWVNNWAPDAIAGCPAKPVATVQDIKDAGDVPLEIPAGWRFELTPPATLRDDGRPVDERPYLPHAGDGMRQVLRQAIADNRHVESSTAKLLRALQAAPEERPTVQEMNPAAADLPAIPMPEPDPLAIAEAILLRYQLPLADQQMFIRYGLAHFVEANIDRDADAEEPED